MIDHDNQSNFDYKITRELRNNPALARNIMSSPDGQKLLNYLQSDGGGFRHAIESAAKGDTDDMARRLRRLMDAPGGADLIERIRRSIESKESNS